MQYSFSHRRRVPAAPRSAVSRHAARSIPAVAALLAAALVVLPAVPAGAERPQVWAVVDATVHVAPGSTLEGATVVIRDGLIEAVGADVPVPSDAITVEGEGLTVWAGWIDSYSHVAMKPVQQQGGGSFLQMMMSGGQREESGAGHEIGQVRPQYRVVDDLIAGDAEVARRREAGFTAALSVPRDGIYRGWSAVVNLGDGHPRDLVVKAEATQHLGFGSAGMIGAYPASLLGTIATIRQVAYDTQRYEVWQARYDANPSGMARPEHNEALAALVDAVQRGTPFVFAAQGGRSAERALRIGDEFQTSPGILVDENAFDYVDLLEGTGAFVILPVAFPDEPDVDDPDRALDVTLDAMRRFKHAPESAARLHEAGVRFALTAYGLSNAADFTENVRDAIDAGLSADAALAAVTTVPAEYLGVDDVMGTVEAGKIANLVVATGSPFGEETKVRHVFVDGRHFEMKEKEQVGDPDAVVDPRGTWRVTTTVMGTERPSTWTISGSEGSYSGSTDSEQGMREFENVQLVGNAMTVTLTTPMGSFDATVVIEGDTFEGTAEIPDGPTLVLKGERIEGPEGGAR